MIELERKSPVFLPGSPARTERRAGWTVVLEYEGEQSGPWLIDLSHCPKWDAQDADISALSPFGRTVPDTPGKCLLDRGILTSRMNGTQASLWCLPGQVPAKPDGSAYTEITEGRALLALMGANIFLVAEKLCSLHFLDRSKTPPFLLQGPFCHVPCQIAVLEQSGPDGAILFSFSPGYAHDMAHAIFDAGAEFGLRPAGESAFVNAMERWSKTPHRKTPAGGKAGGGSKK